MKRLHLCRLFLPVIAFGLCVVTNQDVKASLLDGKQMTLSVGNPTKTSLTFTTSPFVVGPGPELAVPGSGAAISLTLDVSDTKVTFSYPNPSSNQFATASFNGYVLADLSDLTAPFAGAHVDPATTLAGFDNSRISFDVHTLYLNVSGLSVLAGQNLTIALTPEPSAVAMLAIGGISLLGFALRRTRARNAGRT